MFKQNESSTDRVIRVVVGVLALLVGYSSLIGTARTIAYVIGVLALITGIVGYCGLYAIFGISTKK